MKTVILSELMALLAAGSVALPGQDASNAQADNATTQTNTASAVIISTNTPAPGVTNNAPAPATTLVEDKSAATTTNTYTPEGTLRFNFRGAPLDTVLNYMSEAAGFIIVMETTVSGKVDAWSQQPLAKDEAVDLLNTVLHKNGYAAIRNGRTLKIVSRDDAKKYDIPVKKASAPEEIPKNDEMVTQILPVRYANATQMVKDLEKLLPSYANMTANESANSLVLTDTQSDIHRMAEIVKALDTSISAISTVKVFMLRYADAKDMATAIKDLFPTPNTGNGNNGRGNNFNPMAMFGGRGGVGNQTASTAGQSEARAAASKVNAVADERTNALIVSAPEDYMPLIADLVNQIDTEAENVTDLRVFHLTYADPVEMADLLTNVFPDDTKSTDNTRSTFMFGGRFGGANTAAANTSNRTKQKGKVTAVADQRTQSLVVSAARDLMPHIEDMVKQLDSNPAKKQKVYVYQLKNGDADAVKTILQGMFPSSSSALNNNNSSTANALTTRQQQNVQNQSTTTSTTLGNVGGSTSR